MKMSDWEAAASAAQGATGSFLPWPCSLWVIAQLTSLDLCSEDRAPKIPSGCAVIGSGPEAQSLKEQCLLLRSGLARAGRDQPHLHPFL